MEIQKGEVFPTQKARHIKNQGGGIEEEMDRIETRAEETEQSGNVPLVSLTPPILSYPILSYPIRSI